MHDTGDGSYQLTFSVPSAGPFKLDVQLKSGKHRLTVPGLSVAGPTDPSKCLVEHLPPCVAAGQESVFQVGLITAPTTPPLVVCAHVVSCTDQERFWEIKHCSAASNKTPMFNKGVRLFVW